MKTKHLLFLWISIFIFAACGGDKNDIEAGTDPMPEPPTIEGVVLNGATVVLTKEQLGDVTSTVTGNDIYFSSSTDKAKLPTVGKVLLVANPSEMFPYGFMGRVKRISEEHGAYKVETESVALDEVFDELSINQDLRLIPDEEKIRDSGWEYYIDDEEYLCFTRQLKNSTEGLETSGSLTFSIKTNFLVDINNKARKPYVSLTLQARFFSDFSISADLISAERELEWFKRHIPLKIAPATALGGAVSILLRPSIDVVGYAKAEGSFKVSADGHWFKEVVAATMYKDGVWESKCRPLEAGENNFDLEAKAELNGTLKEGISIGMSIRLMNNDIAHADISAKAELVQEANIDYDVLGQYAYDVLKDTYLATRIEVSGSVEGEIPIIKDFPELDEQLFPTIKLHEQKYYLFPLFDDLDVTTNREKLTATVKSGVHRDLLFPDTKIGIQLSDKNMNPLEVSGKMVYQKEEEFPDSWENAFNGLATNVDYHVQPFVQLSFFDKLFCTSSVKKFRIEKLEVFTLEVAEMGENSAVCKGQYKFGEDERPTSYGICYSETNKTPSVSDKEVSGSNIDKEGYFSVSLQGLDREKVYYYRAFATHTDGTTTYGEVRVFGFSPVGTWRSFKCVVMEKKCSHFPEIYVGHQWNSTEGGTMTFNPDNTGYRLLDHEKMMFTWRFDTEERAIYITVQGQPEMKMTSKYSDSEFCIPINDWACGDHITDIYWCYYERID